MIEQKSDDWILVLTTNMKKYAEIHLDIEHLRCFHLMGNIIVDYDEHKKKYSKLICFKNYFIKIHCRLNIKKETILSLKIEGSY